ncbi:MAG: diaminopimelate epimerase, partial [Acidimicrobiales bacterium]
TLTDLVMELRNAGGGPAEMSGNGIRCLAQAAVDAGLVRPGRLTVLTAAGSRAVDYEPGQQPGRAWASVEMGEVRLGEDQAQQFEDRRARRVEVGNPHLVLFGPDPAGIDVATLGQSIQSVHPGGVNVEFVATGPSPGELVLRVWERGVGETLACGTGSVAAAAAARSWGIVGDQVRVHNPGGTLEVTLDPDGIRLAGPVRKVADIVAVPSSVLGTARP